VLQTASASSNIPKCACIAAFMHGHQYTEALHRSITCANISASVS
jgi:hypothetical protein